VHLPSIAHSDDHHSTNNPAFTILILVVLGLFFLCVQLCRCYAGISRIDDDPANHEGDARFGGGGQTDASAGERVPFLNHASYGTQPHVPQHVPSSSAFASLRPGYEAMGSALDLSDMSDSRGGAVGRADIPPNRGEQDSRNPASNSRTLEPIGL